MLAARAAVGTLATLAVVDVLSTIVALAAYEQRVGVVTHDGSAIVEILDSVMPLRELSSAMLWLLLPILLAAVAGTANWGIRSRRSELPAASTAPAAGWRMSAIVAVPLNLIAAAQYQYATANGGAYMRTVQAETTLLLVAAAIALVITTTTGIRVVRRTSRPIWTRSAPARTTEEDHDAR